MIRASQVLPALGLIACVAGCGSSGRGQGAGAALAPVRAPATLRATAVPYLPSAAHRVTPQLLARETQAPALARELVVWGFLAGADRYFQGESRRLQVVDSRTLRFRTAAGATNFVAFLRGHASAYLGSLPRMKRFVSRGRSGILATAQECQCHLANPAYLGVVTRGGDVTWLEINGPGATPRALAQLIAVAP